MTPTEAARILELPADATPEQVEARFHELRAKLEEKIGKAPTPGLKAKYRETLDEITQAFETLALAADSSALPVLKREQGGGRKEKGSGADDGGRKTEGGGAGPAPSSLRPAPASRRKLGREFAVVAVLAVIALAGGGWWVMKTRAANAEKARIAAEAAAEQAAEKADRERQLAHARADLAELNSRWVVFERAERDAERAAAEAKSELREHPAGPSRRHRELDLRAAVTAEYARWLADHLLQHPARLQRARAEELLSSGAVDDARRIIASLRQQFDALERQLKTEAQSRLAITGRLVVTSTPPGLEYELKAQDYADASIKARTPDARHDLLAGNYVAILRRPGWPDQVRTLTVRPDQEVALSAEFPAGGVEITSEPNGAEVWQGGRRLGVTPFRSDAFPTGMSEFELRQKGYQPKSVKLVVTAEQTARGSADLERWPLPETGRAYTIPGLDLMLRPLAPGTFDMGNNSGQLVYIARPVTRVTLTQPFWLGATEVTQAQWTAIMGTDARQLRDRVNSAWPLNSIGPEFPIFYVSHDDALAFCRQLTEREQAAGRLPAGLIYTLPTEAQWEYACRAGSTGDHAGDPEAMGWYSTNSGQRAQPVGRRQANAWGLHDMHGNVAELCLDFYSNELPGGSITDPLTKSGHGRVIRGGNYYNPARNSASYFRGSSAGRNPIEATTGFRVALVRAAN